MPDFERLYQLLQRAQLQQATDSEYEELLSIIQDDGSAEVVAAMDAWHAAQDTPGELPAYEAEVWAPVLKRVLAAEREAVIKGAGGLSAGNALPASNTTNAEGTPNAGSLHAPDAAKAIDSSPHPSIPPTNLPSIKPRLWWAAAATLALLIYAGSRYWASNTTTPHPITTATPKKDFAPGGHRAMLTLADGTQIPLDSAGNGLLAQQGSTRIRKLANGQIAYEGAGTKDGQLLYNTMSTPPGGQYKLMLPDGTLVWLNAASSITYPTAFVEKNRTVTITGEAYFEIAQNPSQPFVVNAANTSISVLGTHFNVNAYTNEKTISTTLLQGAVKVSAGNSQQLLQPGQQANTDAAGNLRLNEHVNTQQIIAWKEGFFSFDNADLPAVMRQLARWYNVEVVYEGPVPQRSFNGEIGRNLTLAQVLKGLSSTRINYRVENNNRIVILP